MFEVCVDSLESAVAAIEGGASRLELCAALSEGGLTPSPGLLKVLKAQSSAQTTPVFCMLRPRAGNDFVYSDLELEIVLYDMEVLRACGADGFVFGALTTERGIAAEQCRKVVEKAAGLPVTFHRAFDVTNAEDMHANCDLVASLGFSRILTSGFEQSAVLGAESVKDLITKHSNIVIMPGAGITKDNLEGLLAKTNCTEFHASCKRRKNADLVKKAVSMGNNQDTDDVYVTDVDLVRIMVDISNRFFKK